MNVPIKYRPIPLFIILLFACMLYSSCSNKGKEAPVIMKKLLVPDESTGLESYMSERAKVKAKLTSPYMLNYQKSDTPYAEFPKSLHVDFYDESMKIESQMDAKYGKYFQNQGKVFLRDSVVVKNIQKGDTVHCKELWWDQHTERFYTDKPVQIYTKDKILFGTGMEADQNFRWYTIKKISGSLLTSEGGMPK